MIHGLWFMVHGRRRGRGHGYHFDLQVCIVYHCARVCKILILSSFACWQFRWLHMCMLESRVGGCRVASWCSTLVWRICGSREKSKLERGCHSRVCACHCLIPPIRGSLYFVTCSTVFSGLLALLHGHQAIIVFVSDTDVGR